MEREYYPITGVEEIYIAEDVVDSSSAYSAGTPEEFAPGQKADWATEQGSEDLYAKNVRQDKFYGSKKETVVVTVTGVSPAKDARIRGIYYDETTGRAYSTGNEEPPFCALGLKVNKGKSDFVCVWFPKGQFTGGKIIGETKKDNVVLNVVEYTFDAFVTDYKYTIDGESKGVSWVKGDTTDDAFSATGFFSAVQTPDTTSAPAAVALSSIVPADAADTVALDAAVVLTFNNKIESDAVMVINTDTGAALAVTKTWDTAGKVLTLSHASAFAVSTKYVVAIAGVVDVYGQALAASGSDFTTAAS